jgi:signal transduction histidine kinase
MELDKNLPAIPINEFVVWEVIEPLIQNSIDHAQLPDVEITIRTVFDIQRRSCLVEISDNGRGIRSDLLQANERGIKKLFLENTSTKENSGNSGYGCYLAYEISKQRCGWDIDAENLPEGGCRFTITIPSQN